MASIAPQMHTRTEKSCDDWITPRALIERIGPFDLDPCASDAQPWRCARKSIRKSEDGLNCEWIKNEFVFCNPPYGRSTADWLKKMANHNHGIALIFARTETQMFFDYIWPKASSVLFLRGRLTFCYPGSGVPAEHNSGGPSVLVGYGAWALTRLQQCEDIGAFMSLCSRERQ